jgi:hypothetical protein
MCTSVPTGCSTSASATAGAPATRWGRPGPDHPARCAAAASTPGRRALRRPGRQPLPRRRGGGAGDRRLRAAQPVAVLLRPGHRRHCGSATSARTARGDQPGPVRGRCRRQLRLEPDGGPRPLRGARPEDHVPPVYEYATRGPEGARSPAGWSTAGARSRSSTGVYLYADAATAASVAWSSTPTAGGRAGRSRASTVARSWPSCPTPTARCYVLDLDGGVRRHRARLTRPRGGRAVECGPMIESLLGDTATTVFTRHRGVGLLIVLATLVLGEVSTGCSGLRRRRRRRGVLRAGARLLPGRLRVRGGADHDLHGRQRHRRGARRSRQRDGRGGSSRC